MISANNATLPSVSATASPASCICKTVMASPLSTCVRMCAQVGNSTIATTIARSSTTSQPTVSLPRSVCINLRSCRLRSATTVEETDRASPSTTPVSKPHPNAIARAMPSPVASKICNSATGTATPRTDSRSFGEKCRPTPNISRITPISATSAARSASAVNPGVNGPITTPATRYPTSGDNFSRVAIAPNTKASPKPIERRAISGESCGTDQGAFLCGWVRESDFRRSVIHNARTSLGERRICPAASSTIWQIPSAHPI